MQTAWDLEIEKRRVSVYSQNSATRAVKHIHKGGFLFVFVFVFELKLFQMLDVLYKAIKVTWHNKAYTEVCIVIYLTNRYINMCFIMMYTYDLSNSLWHF